MSVSLRSVLVAAVVAVAAVPAALTLVACGGRPASPEASPNVLVGVRAPSSHYVELAFERPVGAAALDPAAWRIAAADGGALTVLEARAGVDAQTVVLTTDAQQSATYALTAEGLGIPSAGFVGSSDREPFLESVISLNDRTLLVTFSERMDRTLAEDPASYHLADPNGDEDLDIRVLAAKLDDDETTLVLTTTPQKNLQYEITVAEVKSHFSCGDGVVALLANSAQGTACSAELRPVDTHGVAARVRVKSRTNITRTAVPLADAAGIAGTVATSVAGIGAELGNCTGNPCSSATGGVADEELVFDFDVPVRADQIVLTQAQIGQGGVTVFLSSTATTAYPFTISQTELSNAAVGPDRSYYVAFCPSVPPNTMIDSMKVRAAEKHNCTAGFCLADGRRLDPTRRAANFWGIPPVDTTAPRLLSAVSVGAQGVLLTFSEPLSSAAADPVNFTIAPALTVTAAALTAHETQILLTTAQQVAARQYTVTVANVVDRAGLAIDPAARTAPFIGASQDLYLVSATATSNTTVLLTYSEPMDPATTANLAYYHFTDPDTSRDLDISIFAAAPSADGKSVVLTTSPQDNVLYEITAINMKALYADAYIDPTRNHVRFWGLPAVDNAAPRLVRLERLDGHTLVLTFSEPLSNEAPDPVHFTIAPALAVTAAVQSGPETQIVLTTDTQVPSTAYTLTVSGVVDRARNAIDPAAASATFFGASQTIVVKTAIALDNTHLLVTFSEPVDPATAGDIRNYHLTDPDTSLDVDISILAAAPSADHRTVVLTTSPQSNLQYVLGVANVRSLANDATLDPAHSSVTFAGMPAVDVTAPRLVSLERLDRTTLVLLFSEPVASDSADPANFTLSPQLAVLGAALSLHETQITLTTDGQSPSQPYTLTIRNVVDRARNAIDPAGNSATFFGGSGGLTIESALARSSTDVLVVFSEPVDPATATDVRNYHLSDPDASRDVDIAILAAVLGADGASVVLTTTPQDNVTYVLTATGIDGLHTGSLDVATATFSGVPPADHTAPVVLRAEATGPTTILVTFSEPVSNEAVDPRNFRVVSADARLATELQVLSAVLTASETQIVLTTSPMEVGVIYTLTVQNVVDRAMNPIVAAGGVASFTPASTGQPSARPRLIGAVSTSNTTVLLRFSKSMDDNAIVAANYWIVQEFVNSEVGALAIVSARFADSARTAVELRTRSQNEVTYRVAVSNVSDLSGQPLADATTTTQVADPRTALFPGTAPGHFDAVDTDGDGLNDNVEMRGWVVTITLGDGRTTTRQVTSDPGVIGISADDPVNEAARDTDGDGLDDALEMRLSSDPRSYDTDGDRLDDNEEYNVVFTSQNMVDSDADGIDDAAEVEYFKTNALVADSDGDGFDDGDELFARGRDPRVADLPSHELSLGGVTLALDERYTYTDEEGNTVSTSSSTSSHLSTSESTRHLTSGGIKIAAGVGLDSCSDEICWLFPWNRLTAHADIEGDVHFESESVSESEAAYESSLEKGTELSHGRAVTREIVGASVGVDVTLHNTSDVAYSLTNLEVTLQVPSSQDPTQLVSLATLVPERALVTGGEPEYRLGPGQSRGPIRMVSRDVYPAIVEDLMRAPRGLVFKIANFDVVAEGGRNFAYGLQSVRERTVGIFIDGGDGNVKRYQAITAGVLNRGRDELRCAPTGDHADMPCESGADCGTSLPCQGGSVVGGFAGYDGTGRNAGIPVDFILQDVLQLRRTRPQSLLAGPDGVASSVAHGDDVQLVAAGTAGLTEGTVVVAAGRNLVLDTPALGDDVNPTPADGIKVGADRVVNSVAAGDDVQLIPVGARGAVEDAVAVGAGADGVLDTPVRGDDVADVVTGYEVSTTCNGDTPFAILAGTDRVASTHAAAGDLQGASGAVAGANVPAVRAGADGFLDTIPDAADVYLAPGVPCTADSDCDGGVAGAGRCSGPQKVVRMDARRDGQYRRFWQLMLPDEVQYQTDFGLVRVRSGDLIGLQFIQDLDRDGLTAAAEFLAGSSDLVRDTDGDGIDDFVEVRVGWEIGVAGQPLRRVFSDPRFADSDRDGLGDLEESDLRPAQCACGATGPTTLMAAFSGAPCSTNAQCGGGTCFSLTECTPAMVERGEPCPVCSGEVTRFRTDPRASDTDADGVSDFDEVFGYLTGAGVVDAGSAQVILAGSDLKADTRACPRNHCLGSADWCSLDGDCASRRCVRPVFCDDVQVVPVGTGVQSARTVVVAPGPIGFRRHAGLYTRGADVAATDVVFAGGAGVGANVGESLSVGDDIPVVGLGEATSFHPVAGELRCVDGSHFETGALVDLPKRFALCAVVKAGPDGYLASQPAGDDVVVPAAYGQRVEWSNPLDPDSDRDFVRDGVERLLGSSPTDSGDTGQDGDRDRDGLTDNQETLGWTVGSGPGAHVVFSNPNAADTDLDGVPDYAERNRRCGEAPSIACPTDPTRRDTDGDGLSDLDELSRNELERLAGFSQYFTGFRLDVAAAKPYGTDPTLADTDGDGVGDAVEALTTYTIALTDGSTRTVASNPTARDTDGDALDDGMERLYHADATDPDTDDDGRIDGLESPAQGFDPIVPDLKITVHIERIDVDAINTDGIDGEGEFGFWILVRSDVLARSGLPSPKLVASALDARCSNDALSSTTGCFPSNKVEHTDGCTQLDMSERNTVRLNKDVSFTLREGEFFTIEGLLAEFDSQTDDCGKAPNYIPRAFKSGCYNRFNKFLNFSELASGTRGEAIAVNPADAGQQGGDNCSWSVISTVVVE